MNSFRGLRLGYHVELQQNGNRVSGTGRKVTENGRAIAAHGQTPIVVDGTIDGNRLTLTFTEQGARRVSEGKFVLHVEDEGVLRGRFASNAARSAGAVQARRQNQAVRDQGLGR